MKTRFFQLVFSLSFTVFTNTTGMAQDIPNPKPTTEIPASKELEVKNDSISTQELKRIETDSIVNDSLSQPKKLLEAIVTYKAKRLYIGQSKKHNKYIFIIKLKSNIKIWILKQELLSLIMAKTLFMQGTFKRFLGKLQPTSCI